MKKVTKTYGVYDLLEWNAVFSIGNSGAKMHISFEGGASTSMGIKPAEFTTSDRLTQHVIEHSGYFSNGKIRLLALYEDDSDDSEPSAVVVSDEEEIPRLDGDALGEQVDPAVAVDGSGDHTDDGENSDEGVLSFAVLEDARDYFEENHQIARSKIRSKANAEELAHGLGLVIHWG